MVLLSFGLIQTVLKLYQFPLFHSVFEKMHIIKVIYYQSKPNGIQCYLYLARIRDRIDYFYQKSCFSLYLSLFTLLFEY